MTIEAAFNASQATAMSTPHSGRASAVGNHRSRRRRPRGAVLVLVAVMLTVILVFVGLMVDANWMALAKTEQQLAVDEAARATLMAYSTKTGATTSAETVRRRDALDRGQQMFGEDQIGGRQQQVDAQIILGQATFAANGAKTFVANRTPFNAVRRSV